MIKKISFLAFIILLIAINKDKNNSTYIFHKLINRTPNFSQQVESLGGKAHKIDTSVFQPAKAVHNPGILRYNNKLLMTFRVQGHRPKASNNFAETFIAEVDSNYKIIWVRPLFKDFDGIIHEDARLFTLEGELYASIVTDVAYEYEGNRLYRHFMGIGKLDENYQLTELFRPKIGSNLAKDSLEKNWLFMDKEGKKLVINWLDPLTLWEIEKDNFNAPIHKITLPRVINDWAYGEVRASTTPIFIPKLNQYLCFFHSFKEKSHPKIFSKLFFMRRIYYLGALLFDKDFKITSYTKSPVFISTPEVKPYISSYTILPYGAILEEGEKDRITLSIGINDREAWVAEIPLTEILGKMTKINSD